MKSALAVAAFLSCAVLSAADAAIKCDGQFQISGGNRIATPYCEDRYLARVARTHGAHVPASAIAGSAFEKERLCRFTGYDPRVRDICAGSMPETDRGR